MSKLIIAVGMVLPTPDAMLKYLEDGYRFIATASDSAIMMQSAKSILTKILQSV